MAQNLDLHGIKHADVQWLVENHVATNKAPYNIITGNSDKMKSIVTEILDKYNMKYIIWSHNLGSINVLDDVDNVQIKGTLLYSQRKRKRIIK